MSRLDGVSFWECDNGLGDLLRDSAEEDARSEQAFQQSRPSASYSIGDPDDEEGLAERMDAWTEDEHQDFRNSRPKNPDRYQPGSPLHGGKR